MSVQLTSDRLSVRRTDSVFSGEQIHLGRDGHHAVIVEVSGGVREYEVRGRRLLDGYGEDEMCSAARGQLLIPWPNRLRDGRYRFDGQEYQVPVSEPEKNNAIHDFLRYESWTVAEPTDDRVVMEHTLHPRASYPFALRVLSEYRVSREGLSARVTATNLGRRPCPYGMGVPPYLRVDDETLELSWLEAPGAVQLMTDEQAIPVGTADVSGTPYDFRTSTRILGSELDTAFTDLRRDERGRAWARLWRGRGDYGVGLWMDEHYPYYMFFTGDSLPDRARRRRSVGVEPMTCAPNAFASGEGLITLAPGESVTSCRGISPLGTP